jgi:hypothetical protein
MYEWRTLRMAAAVLISLPLIHLAYLLANDLADYLDPRPEVWQRHMSELVKQDQESALPENPTLVIGGQRVRLWKDLPARLLPRPVLMRPLGDASLEDLTHYYDRLVAFYQPSVLIVFPGYADMHLRTEKTPAEFEYSLRTLLDMDRSYKGSTRRYLIAPLQMPLHPGDRERIDSMVARAQRLAQEFDDFTVIDPNPILCGPDGRPNPAYYRGDGINLSDEGYARISLLLEMELRPDSQVAQTGSPQATLASL